jgi:orotidine-5'-phosphate decarboxylase
MRNPIIAALDVPSREAALALVKKIAPAVGAFKVGNQLFTVAGPEIVARIRETGASVFLDLKFHDIPNTVAKAVAAAARLDAQMLTVHISGGSKMLRDAEKAARENAIGPIPPLVLGVTVLTSMGDAGRFEGFGLFALGNCGASSDCAGRCAIGHAWNSWVGRRRRSHRKNRRYWPDRRSKADPQRP